VSLKGGLGSASATWDGVTVGAVAAVNAAGSAVVGAGPWFWAAPFEEQGEFGGCGFPARLPDGALAPVTKGSPRASTTLAVVATDATLTKAEAKRLAIMAQVGLARALYPVHTPLDGDVVFAVATGRKPTPAALLGLTALGTVAANCLARAVARGVYAATALPFPGALPAWRDRFAPQGQRPGEQT
jgi:L-aminopeptidase/D-esterase-like protein